MTMPPRHPRSPAEIFRGRPSPPARSEAERAAIFSRAGIRLAPSPDTGEAARLWEAHVDAARIGVPAPAPPPPAPGCDYGLASLARILGLAHPERGRMNASLTPEGAGQAHGTILDFAPVPVAARHDGWTAEKQRAFIEVLADCGSVQAAAKAVGMGVEGANRLRRRPDAAAFAQAWDAAYGVMTQRLTDAAFTRAIHGVRNPVFFRGELIGERIGYDERLTRYLLERHDPRGHGYLHDSDPAWAAKRDPLAPRLARLPRLLGRLFGATGDPAPQAEAPAATAPNAPTRRARR